ncbi:hypothetical protein DPEC_G00011160 [Dallia pectoralis]|uniref:Uncharacterized protein n=1 Tax=Dallia pectoralis TaxID=75939 RepID=A0ACC2HLC8_DALPE|nr:hypothetical protein DPEC_G00011160 [Dallia pectoralis]
MTLSIFPMDIPSAFAHKWLFDDITCQVYAMCGVLFSMCSLTNLTALSSVCCLKISFPNYGNRFSSSHACVLLVAIWCYATVFAIGPLTQYIMSCTVIFLSYTFILLTVHRSRRAIQQHQSTKNKTTNAHSLIVKLSVAVCIGFLGTWSPYAITAMSAAFIDTTLVPPTAFAVSAIFAKSSTVYNPTVYLLCKPNFPIHFYRLKILLILDLHNRYTS